MKIIVGPSFFNNAQCHAVYILLVEQDLEVITHSFMLIDIIRFILVITGFMKCKINFSTHAI